MPLLAKEKNHVRWETVLDIMQSLPTVPSEEFELTANSLGAHMKVTESSQCGSTCEFTEM